MEISILLKEYREACSLTQQMLVNEIEMESRHKIKTSVSIINGIEHGSSIVNAELSTYIYRKFLYLDRTRNNEIISLSFKLAEYYAKNNIELNIGKIFSFISFTDFLNYTIQDINFEFTEDEKTLLISLSTEINININISKVNQSLDEQDIFNQLFDYNDSIRLNDAAIFIFNFTFWYIIKYQKNEDFDLKSCNSVEFLSDIANIFGYENYISANEKVRGKTLKYISRRISLYEFFINIPSIRNFLNSLEEDRNKFVKGLSFASDEDRKKSETNEYQEDEKKFKDILANSNFSNEEALEYAKKALKFTSILSSMLLMMYSTYQGNYLIVSIKEMYNIYDRFIIEGLFENNNIRERIETFKRDFESKYNEFLHEGNPNIYFSLFRMQKVFYKIYKYHYLAKQSLSQY